MPRLDILSLSRPDQQPTLTTWSHHMASSVFYKFKSQREESKVSFDGTGISLFDLKKEIILANSLGKSSDFDLVVFDGSSGEGLSHAPYTIVALISSMILVELRDDSHVIPRSSSVIVKRMPPARPGKGKAAMYIGAPGTSATPESKPNNQPGSASWSSRGSMSRRFDREVSRPATVRVIRPCFLNSVPYAPVSRVDSPPKYNWQG